MSCIRFTTEAMKQQLLTAPSVDEPVAQFLSPVLSESKITRLKLLAKNANPKIRESVALNYHTPGMVLWELSIDVADSVRECVARNPYTPQGVLEELSEDKSERVRAFIASNKSTPEHVLQKLVQDKSVLVQNVAKLYLG